MASTVGVEVTRGPKDYDKLKQDLIAAGYKGEKVVILAASTIPTIWAEAQVASDTLKKIGMNTDFQALEWGTVVQRRASQEPIDKGGWNIFYTYLGGFGNISPAPNITIQSSGTNGSWFGWPTDPKMEELRAAWFDAPDVAAQKKICEAMQVEFWQSPPYAPLGMYDQPTAFHNYLQDIRDGWPQFYGVKKNADNARTLGGARTCDDATFSSRRWPARRRSQRRTSCRAETQRVLKFLPQADLATLDPVWTTADVTRNHAHLVFDTLYGQDNNFQPQPQMAAGHAISADGRQWDITLRDGLKFHDGSPVLARDCVASIQRWWQRDGFGGVLRAATDEVSAPSDRQIRFRLKKPFPLLADALARHHQHVLHHAGAAGADRSDEAGERDGRLRPVSLRRVRAGGRLARGVRAVRRLCAAHRRSGRDDRGAEDGAFRPGANGPWCPIRRPRPPRCAPASSTGGRTRRSIC